MRTSDGPTVAAADQHWDWQYRREPDDGWRTFGRSGHRIYTVLSLPTLPWVQQPATPINAGLPWTDVLEYACGWAHGAHTADEAARGVTEGVFALGPHVVTYDCPGGGASHYSALGFDCTSFLDRLRGGPGSGQYVNCSDCATFVSTFANVLGCDLWQSRMGWGFALNPILAIGSAQWQTACGWPSFNYHEVAWEGDCGADDDVFDGCLEVDGDANPAGPPHHGLLPCDLRFGQVGDMQYRDRLATATPGGSANCQPQPGTRLRRTVF